MTKFAMTHDEAVEAARQRAEEALVENLTLGMLRDEIRAAVSEGLEKAMTDEAARKFWGVGIEMLQNQAARRTGRFLLDGVWYVTRRAFWVLIAFVSLYAIGRWRLVTLVWDSIFARGTS